MKITKRQLKRIIKEEKQKLLNEFGPRGTDGASPLLDFAHAYAKLGGAIQEQVEAVIIAHVNNGEDSFEFQEAVFKQNPAGIRQAMDALRHPLSQSDSEDAHDLKLALENAIDLYDEGDDDERRDADASGDHYDSRPTRMS